MFIWVNISVRWYARPPSTKKTKKANSFRRHCRIDNTSGHNVIQSVETPTNPFIHRLLVCHKSKQYTNLLVHGLSVQNDSTIANDPASMASLDCVVKGVVSAGRAKKVNSSYRSERENIRYRAMRHETSDVIETATQISGRTSAKTPPETDSPSPKVHQMLA